MRFTAAGTAPVFHRIPLTIIGTKIEIFWIVGRQVGKKVFKWEQMRLYAMINSTP